MSLQRALVPPPLHTPRSRPFACKAWSPEWQQGTCPPASRLPRSGGGTPLLTLSGGFPDFCFGGSGWGMGRGGSTDSPTQILPVPKGSSSHLPVIHRRCVRVRGGSPLHVSPSCFARYKTCAPFCSCQGERGGASGKGGGGGGKMLINPPALIFSSVRWSLGRKRRFGEEGGGRGGRR